MCEKTLRYPWETWKEGIKKEGEDGWGNGDKEHNLSTWESGGSFFFYVETL